MIEGYVLSYLRSLSYRMLWIGGSLLLLAFGSLFIAEWDARAVTILLTLLSLPHLLFGLWLRLFGPSRHPAITSLADYGPVPVVASEIDAATKRGGDYYGSWRLVGAYSRPGSAWFLSAGFYNLAAVPLRHIVWFYRKVTTINESINFIPTGKETKTSVVMHQRSGHELEISASKPDELLHRLTQQAPWAFSGYSEELEKMVTDLPSVIAEVDRRRLALEGP
jgi:hypothetical protein